MALHNYIRSIVKNPSPFLGRQLVHSDGGGAQLGSVVVQLASVADGEVVVAEGEVVLGNGLVRTV